MKTDKETIDELRVKVISYRVAIRKLAQLYDTFTDKMSEAGYETCNDCPAKQLCDKKCCDVIEKWAMTMPDDIKIITAKQERSR